MIKKTLKHIKNSSRGKKVFYAVSVGLVLGATWFIFFKKPLPSETFIIHRADFFQQVAVSGEVAAAEELNLSFEQTGVVRRMLVKVGDQVPSGKLIASQDVSQLSAQLAETQAGIDLQKAKLDQLLAGSSPENIKVAQDKITLAAQNLRDGYDNALTQLNSAYNVMYVAHSTVLTIQNNYFNAGDQQSNNVQDARLSIAASMSKVKNYIDTAKISKSEADITTALSKTMAGLNDAYESVSIVRDQCDVGSYYARVSATDKASLDTQKTNLNNAKEDVVLSQQDISSLAIVLLQANSNLDLVKALPREADIAVYQAQIKQAQAQAQNIFSQIRKREIVAPINGIITEVNAKNGTVINANETAVAMISSNDFEIESYVPQIYIGLVTVGDEADVTLDAYGPDTIFKAKVIAIDPSETIKDGVSNYKTTLAFVDGENQIKDGMTANVVIITDKKSNAIAIPQGLVIDRDGKRFVNVLQGKDVVEKEIQTGLISSSGQIEVLHGLSEGDTLPLK